VRDKRHGGDQRVVAVVGCNDNRPERESCEMAIGDTSSAIEHDFNYDCLSDSRRIPRPILFGVPETFGPSIRSGEAGR